MSNQASFACQVLNWYDTCGRTDLPWRQNITPYRIWVSEIMLQQTQVNTVIPYFRRFEDRFPNITALADASLDEVLHLWTGLGYYARGRNLHKTANIVCKDFNGEFPRDNVALEQLPGIGRSTAGAICAIAFDQATPILDGNVKRVLTRYHRIKGWPGQSAVQKKLWQVAETSTPTDRSADYTQAIMDLGATLCTRSKPNCLACPLQVKCQAHTAAVTDQYPTSKPRKTLPVRTTYFLIMVNSQGQVLLQLRPPTGLWGGLWCFPECTDEAAIATTCQQLGFAIRHYRVDQQQRHTFSHYHLDYKPVHINAVPEPHVADSTIAWVNIDDPGQLGLPRPVEQLLKTIRE
ncbi:MAG: A/G-specific adenine glycosylase [Gammaproteobacteria bacterium]|nr:MAG: A/G-specific adenine glycosylase [Gammaproteobacteria bacterium]